MSKIVIFLLIIAPFALCQKSDASTLDGKIIFGYQGWFNTPSDGGNVGWRHWSKSESTMSPNTVNIELWPDMSEYPQDATQETDLILPNGQKARLFSSLYQSVMDVHFQWLQKYNLDGTFLQRFLGELEDGRFFTIRNKITTNMRSSAEKYGRTFAIMYDITGVTSNHLNKLKNDWTYLVNTLKITQSSQYQKHNGKPVVTIWGPGFTHINMSADDTLAMIAWFKSQGCYVVGGVPYHWRILSGDSKPEFGNAYRQYDALSPWTVGRFGSTGVDDAYDNTIIPDKTLTLANNQYFAPVLFPGSSWSNMQQNPALFNENPRYGGNFFWSQAQKCLTQLPRQKTFLYLAMFDEVDEGTAFLKAAPTKATVPVNPNFLTMDTDGVKDPSDRYLFLAGQASNMLKNASIPVFPANITFVGPLASNGASSLKQNQCYFSDNKAHKLCVHPNGTINYSSATSVIWTSPAPNASTNPGPYRLNMQGDGNLVAYGSKSPYFASKGGQGWVSLKTTTQGPYKLIINNGYLILNDSTGAYYKYSV